MVGCSPAGNVLSFVVLVQAFGRSPMFYVLRAVAVSDAVFLLTVLLIQTVVNMFPYTGVLAACFQVNFDMLMCLSQVCL